MVAAVAPGLSPESEVSFSLLPPPPSSSSYVAVGEAVIVGETDVVGADEGLWVEMSVMTRA